VRKNCVFLPVHVCESLDRVRLPRKLSLCSGHRASTSLQVVQVSQALRVSLRRSLHVRQVLLIEVSTVVSELD